MSEAKKYLLVSPAGYGAADRFEFTYHSDHDVPVGSLVKIPLLRRQVWGVVTGTETKPSFKTKALSLPTTHYSLPTQLVDLARWLFEYYLASPAAIWQTILPAGLDKPPKSQRPAYDFPRINWPKQDLSEDQKAAIQIARQNPGPFLLHGVTGSGKTQVYLDLAQEAVSNGKSVIILVPEIALTPQIIARFYEVFGDKVVSRHSRMTPAQKFLNWQEILEAKEPKVIIGPRSCLFLPVKNLGLIAIDECHETTYKSEQAPRYQSDAVAAKLASLHGAKLILGSATPSVAQIFLAHNQRLKLLEMTQRAGGQPLPQGTIVDLRQKPDKSSFISRELRDALTESLSSGRQSLLFINRRGSATTHICSECGYVSKCPSCQLPATFHADKLKLVCHHCGWNEAPPSVCPPPAGGCGQQAFKYLGGGTQRIEAEVKTMFPEARISRLDKDTATAKFVHQTHVDLHEGKTDILIGTQMIAKGLNLPLMDTVGIILADSMLHLPDFTAAERTFQLISQVSGRTGRSGDPGKVIIQTYSPEHPAIVAAAEGNFAGFTAAELEQRKLLKYPPFTYLLKISLAAKTADKAQADLSALAQQLNHQGPSLMVLGPAPAYREHSGGKFHWQLILKSPRRSVLLKAAKLVPNPYTLDPDPINLL